MYLCYIDESGDTGMLDTKKDDSTPVFVISGIFLDHTQIRAFIQGFIELKKSYFPSVYNGMRHHDIIKEEIKGSDLRHRKIIKNKAKWRHTSAFIGDFFKLLRKCEVRFCSKIYVKKPDTQNDSNAMYTSSIQYICDEFQAFLDEKNEVGIVVSDSRNHVQNINVSHSIFTQMFKNTGDNYSRLVDMPTYGHSNNHSGLQACDILCSTLLFPIAAHTFCIQHMQELRNTHIQPCHEQLRLAFSGEINQLQYRRKSDKGYQIGGVFITNNMNDIHPREITKKPALAPNAPASNTSIKRLLDRFNGNAK